MLRRTKVRKKKNKCGWKERGEELNFGNEIEWQSKKGVAWTFFGMINEKQLKFKKSKSKTVAQ